MPVDALGHRGPKTNLSRKYQLCCYLVESYSYRQVLQFDWLLYRRAFSKDFSVEGPTTKRDFREKRKSGEVFSFVGLFVFLSSLDLISCNFSMIFAHSQTKGDITRGAKTLQCGEGGGNIGAGRL